MSAGLARQPSRIDLSRGCFFREGPNVGKSSLLNKILNRKALARVSATPGKTITINFYKIDDGRLVDLPGYGYAKRSKAETARFSELCEGYFSEEEKRGFGGSAYRYAPPGLAGRHEHDKLSLRLRFSLCACADKVGQA